VRALSSNVRCAPRRISPNSGCRIGTGPQVRDRRSGAGPSRTGRKSAAHRLRGSPWTVATYMVEGGGSKTFGQIKRMMYEAPRDLHRLLGVLAKATILYLNAQIAAGAHAVMLFDTWGGVLTPVQYEEFSLRYMAEVIDALTRMSAGRRVPASCSRRAAAHGSRKSQPLAAMPSASIGPRTLRRAASGRRPRGVAGQSRFRRLCSRRPRPCARKLCECSRATAKAPGMSSIWVTVLPRTSTPSGSRYWSTPCKATC